MRVFLDGIEYTTDADLDKVTVEYTEDSDTKTVQRKISGSVTFIGDAYTYLNDKFFADCDDYRNIITVTVQPDCCDVSHDFKAVYNAVEKNATDCQIKVTLQEIDDEVRGFRYLNDTIYWKDGFPEAFDHPKIHYCVNHIGFISIILLIIRFTMSPILFILEQIETAINGITLGLFNINIPSLDDYDRFLTGCGFYQTAPLVLNILAYNCQKAGLQFSSTIIQSNPYQRLALFQAQYEKGDKPGGDDFIEGNAANLTTTQLLDLLKPVFNADYRIIDGTLHFEHPDKLDELNKESLDLTGDTDYALKYETITAPAYGRFSYTQDAIDQEGNEAASFYNDIIEWNDPPNDWQKGEKNNTVRFSPPSFMFGVSQIRDAKKFNADFLIDLFRISKNPIFGTTGGKRRSDLVMSSHTSAELKLIVLRQGYNPEDAEQIRRKVDRYRGYDYYENNYPMSFREEKTEGLYRKFHKRDDPRKDGFAYYVVPKMTKLLNCEDITKINEFGNNLNLITDAGTGRAQSIKVDYGDGLITFTNIRIKC